MKTVMKRISVAALALVMCAAFMPVLGGQAHAGSSVIKLPNNKAVTVAPQGSWTFDQMFSYKAPGTGVVKLHVNNNGYNYYAQGFTAGGKKLTEQMRNGNFPGGVVTLAVSKGKTYHIKLYRLDSDHSPTVKAVFTKVKEKSGKKKSKAKTIKKGKWAKGTISMGERKADWYKFKVKKNNSRATLDVYGEVSGMMVFTVYAKKGGKLKKLGSRTSLGFNAFEGSFKLTYSTRMGKVQKGTYYVKVSPKNSLSNGYYQLKYR